MAKIVLPVNPVMPSPSSLATRRNVLRGAAGLGIGAALGAAFSAGAQDQQGTPGPGTPVANPSTPVPGGYVGSNASTAGDTGAGAPTPGPVQPFKPYDPFLQPATPGPKNFELVCEDQTLWIAPDVAYAGWTFNGTIPGPIFRAVQGDKITVKVINRANMAHSADFHSAKVDPETGYKSILPGESHEWSYTATYPGAFMYHCGTAPVLMHIGAGMYGAMIVDPKEGWEPATEFAFVQSEFYLMPGPNGVMVPDFTKLQNLQNMDYVVFNGYSNLYVDRPIRVRVGDLVRIFVVNAGPNIWTSFHVVGAIFDKVYFNANPKNVMYGMQSISIGPGDGACVELRFDEPGTYVAVNHSFGHASHGAQAKIHAE